MIIPCGFFKYFLSLIQHIILENVDIKLSVYNEFKNNLH